uniref:Uncharacterized protein n=1 Tax=Arundo donax TaxID=35708 RepID=A0A0A9CCV1_ARUDO
MLIYGQHSHESYKSVHHSRAGMNHIQL